MPYIGNTAADRFVAAKAATQFSGNGSTTAFTLDHAVGSDEDILVSVDGVIQEPSVAYAVSNGTTLTFTAAPSSDSGNNIFVYYLFRTIGTVGHPSNQALSATTGTFSGAITGGGLLTTGGNIVIPNAGNIGSASDTDAMSISSGGVVTFSQTPVGTTFVGTEVASTSGTEVAFTSISSTAKRITLMFREVSLNANEDMMVQLGTSGGLKTSGYLSNSHYGSGGTGSTAGFALYNGGGSSNVLSGAMMIYHMGSNKYINSHSAKYNQNNGLFGGGSVELSGTLDRISIKSQGSGSFDAGAINIMIES